MKTFADVIDALGGSIALAEALGQPKGTVSAWKTRNSVPPEYWPAIARIAAESNVAWVTIDALTGMVVSRKRSSSSTIEAA